MDLLTERSGNVYVSKVKYSKGKERSKLSENKKGIRN